MEKEINLSTLVYKKIKEGWILEGALRDTALRIFNEDMSKIIEIDENCLTFRERNEFSWKNSKTVIGDFAILVKELTRPIPKAKSNNEIDLKKF